MISRRPEAARPYPTQPALGRLKQWAQIVRLDVHALYFAARDPRMPWYAKALALIVAGYALSPIDLIPDFIPVVGHLDDAILVPLGIFLVLRMIPPHLMTEHRKRAAAATERPVSRTAVWAIGGVWICCAALGGWFAWGYLGR